MTRALTIAAMLTACDPATTYEAQTADALCERQDRCLAPMDRDACLAATVPQVDALTACRLDAGCELDSDAADACIAAYGTQDCGPWLPGEPAECAGVWRGCDDDALRACLFGDAASVR